MNASSADELAEYLAAETSQPGGEE
jgi:hypothetical protein